MVVASLGWRVRQLGQGGKEGYGGVDQFLCLNRCFRRDFTKGLPVPATFEAMAFNKMMHSHES